MAISTAVSLDRVSRVVGYKIKSENFNPDTPYLPQRIAILGEANTANQVGLTTASFEFINAKEVGDKYGYGSPLHQMARILRPLSGDLLGGISTVIYPQISDGGATASIITKSVTGTATSSTTHYVVINGRSSVDNARYAFDIVKGDTAAAIATKIIDAVTNVLGSPVLAADNLGNIDFTTKWEGVTAAELNIEFDSGDDDAGIVYAETANTDGTGTVDIATSLTLFGDNWNTLVINPYGTTEFATYETYNGIPDPTNPTGRYIGTNFKPFVVFTGSVLSSKTSIVAITDATARKSEVTNVLAPAPNSKGWTWEAAANMLITYAYIAQNSPHLGNGGRSYPDMPIPADGDIADFADYTARDYMVQRGSSTVSLENGKYTVQDMVTTYHPDGELPPKFRKTRDLVVDWNVAYGWITIQKRDIQDKAIVSDADVVTVGATISPKQAKQLVISFIKDKASEALIVDTDFAIDSIVVGVNSSNASRLDIFFRYKRSSTADIVSTDAAIDFAFSL